MVFVGILNHVFAAHKIVSNLYQTTEFLLSNLDRYQTHKTFDEMYINLQGTTIKKDRED